MSKVLFLGAGASAASSYEVPTMRTFFRKDDFGTETTYRYLRDFLKDFCGTNDITQEGVKNVNLEEVLTYLDNLEYEHLPITLQRKLALEQVRSQLDSYVLWRLVEEPLRNRPGTGTYLFEKFTCDVHERLFRHKELDFTRDTILTLNYDLVADGTLKSMESKQASTSDPPEGLGNFLNRSGRILGDLGAWDDIGMPLVPQEERAIFLKLHGSVDYYSCPNPNCPNHWIIYANRCTKKGGPLDVQRMLCKMCGRKFSLGIIPPTLSKATGSFPRIGAFWSIAYERLREAAHWVIWGVSLAESDHMLRTLLREAAAEHDRSNPKEPFTIDVVNTVFDPEQKQHESKDEFENRRSESRRIAAILQQLARGNVKFFVAVEKWPDEEQEAWW